MADTKKKKSKNKNFTQKDVDEYCKAIQEAFDTDKKLFCLLRTSKHERVLINKTTGGETLGLFVGLAEQNRMCKIAITATGIIVR